MCAWPIGAWTVLASHRYAWALLMSPVKHPMRLKPQPPQLWPGKAAKGLECIWAGPHIGVARRIGRTHIHHLPFPVRPAQALRIAQDCWPTTVAAHLIRTFGACPGFSSVFLCHFDTSCPLRVKPNPGFTVLILLGLNYPSSNKTKRAERLLKKTMQNQALE